MTSNTDDDDKDMDVLLGCKLVISAAGLIGAQTTSLLYQMEMLCCIVS
jgi:hypothetical protein